MKPSKQLLDEGKSIQSVLSEGRAEAKEVLKLAKHIGRFKTRDRDVGEFVFQLTGIVEEVAKSDANVEQLVKFFRNELFALADIVDEEPEEDF